MKKYLSRNSFVVKLFSFLLFACACEKDKEAIIMPEETSVGANTFGCYANNELFVHPKKKKVGKFGLPSLDADYIDNILTITAYDFHNRAISISDSLVQVGKTHRVVTAQYKDENNNYFTSNDESFAEIHLTKLDTINLIVSGRFSFRAKHNKSDSIIIVSGGRFDIQLFDRYTKIK